MTVTLYTAQGEPFTVDDEDAPLIRRFSWRRSTSCSQSTSYLTTEVKPSSGVAGNLFLQQLIMGAPPVPGHRVYNIRRDALCMEKSNLAWLDASTLRHWAHAVENPNGYKGVTFVRRVKAWQMALANRTAPQYFPSAEAAALAYDAAARKRYGAWANVNFPRPGDPKPCGHAFRTFEGPLHGEDGAILHVDTAFLPLLSRHSWQPGPNGYWTRITGLHIPLVYLILGRQGQGRSKIVWLDGDVRNCKRANLAWRPVNQSGFRGVGRKGYRWGAQIAVSGIIHRLGTYATPEEAAHAYDTAARELLGPEAHLNFPDDDLL